MIDVLLVILSAFITAGVIAAGALGGLLFVCLGVLLSGLLLAGTFAAILMARGLSA